MKSGEYIIEDPSQYFYVNNGAVLRSLNDLLVELKRIEDSAFKHHVNSEKNDFGNWIKDVLKEKALAKNISSSKSLPAMIEVLEKKLKVSSSKPSKRNKKVVITQIRESVGNG